MLVSVDNTILCGKTYAPGEVIANDHVKALSAEKIKELCERKVLLDTHAESAFVAEEPVSAEAVIEEAEDEMDSAFSIDASAAITAPKQRKRRGKE